MLLISLYNTHNKSMNVSGPNDPSASLFHMMEGDETIMDMVQNHPEAFRFVVDVKTGLIHHAPNIASVQSLLDPLRKTHFKPDKVQVFFLHSKWVNRDYFIRNLRLDNSI